MIFITSCYCFGHEQEDGSDEPHAAANVWLHVRRGLNHSLIAWIIHVLSGATYLPSVWRAPA